MSKTTPKLLPIFAVARLRKDFALLDSLAPLVLVPLGRGRSSGIYLGIDLISGNNVYWDFNKSSSPHALVVGPTGSGKTIALLTLLNRITTAYGSSALIFDIKDEYAQLLSIFKHSSNNLKIINPLERPLPLCICSDSITEKQSTISIAVDALSKTFPLTPMSSRTLFKALVDICTQCIDIGALVDYHFDVISRELEDVVDVITRVFGVYPEPPLELSPITKTQIANRGGVYIVNLKYLFNRDRAESAAVILYMLKSLLTYLSPSSASAPRIVTALDELWHTIPYMVEELVNILARYGRSLGLALVMATQNIEDLHPYTDAIISNCGGLIAMSSSSTSYWLRVRKYLNLSRKAVGYVMSIADQGIGVARFSPSSTPVILYVDPLNDSEIQRVKNT